MARLLIRRSKKAIWKRECIVNVYVNVDAREKTTESSYKHATGKQPKQFMLNGHSEFFADCTDNDRDC